MKEFSLQLNVFQKPEAAIAIKVAFLYSFEKKFGNLSKTCSYRSEWCCQKTHVQDFWPVIIINQMSEVNGSVMLRIFSRTIDNVENDGLTEKLHDSFSDRFYGNKHLIFISILFPISRKFPISHQNHSELVFSKNVGIMIKCTSKICTEDRVQ